MATQYDLQEKNIVAAMLSKQVMNWFNLRVNIMSLSILIFTYGLCTYFRRTIDPVLVGITLIYVSQL